jgi:polyisoprenoid-binding protein YceI
VAIPPGTHRLGPAEATLAVHTKRSGAAAMAGHDLRISVESWEATLAIAADDADSSLELTADAGSLRVVEGIGGMQELSDDDKQNIKTTIDDEILQRMPVTYRSTRVASDGDALHVDGDLTLIGNVHPLSFDITFADDGTLRASAVITQSHWDMKPYSALFGTLKVMDDVEVTVEGRIPS